MSSIRKIYITGTAGTGKSTIAKELSKRGIAVFDIDRIPGLCRWKNKKTLEVVDYHSGASREWLDNHEWICDIKQLEGLMNTAKDLVVVVGGPSNQDAVLPLFDKVFLLQCSEKTLIDRLTHRVGTDEFGKTSDEQGLILQSYKSFEEEMIWKGAIPINSEESVEKVVDNILSQK